jgi:hypothetical protein
MFKKHIEEVEVLIYDLPMLIGSWCFNHHFLVTGYDMQRFDHAGVSFKLCWLHCYSATPTKP